MHCSRWNYAGAVDVRFQHASPEHLNATLDFIKQLDPDSYEKRYEDMSLTRILKGMRVDFQRHPERMLLAMHGGRVIGLAEYEPMSDQYHDSVASMSIVLVKEFQGKGIGHALNARLEEAVKAAGFDYGVAMVYARNEAHSDRLQRLGWPLSQDQYSGAALSDAYGDDESYSNASSETGDLELWKALKPELAGIAPRKREDEY